MDMVVISTWKQTHRAVFGARIGEGYTVPRGAARILSRTHVRMNGMAQGYDPHMLDAANLAKLSWDNVSRMTIARCWVKGFREAVRRSNANATRQLLITDMSPRRS